MKLLLDENLSRDLVPLLSDLYPGTVHVREIGLSRASDSVIWAFAGEHGFAIVTKDKDFSQRARQAPIPVKIIWLRMGNCSIADTEWMMRSFYRVIREFLERGVDPCLQLPEGITLASLRSAQIHV